MREKRIVKVLLAVLLCVIVVLSLAVMPALAAPGKDDALTVGVPANRCPVFYQDTDTGELTGIGVDLMRTAAEEAGYSVTFMPIGEGTLKDALDNDVYDIVLPFGSAITSSAGNPSVVSDKLIQTPFVLVTENRREVPPLNDIRVGMLSSLGGGAETVRKLFPGIEITMYDTMDECVNALRAGKVDALLHNSYVWSYVLQKPSYGDLVVQPSAMFSMDFRAGAKDTQEGRMIIERLNSGIASLTDTRRQAIVLEHTSKRLYQYDLYDYLYQYRLAILFVVLLLAAIIVIAMQRIHAVRKEQEEKLRYDGLTGLPNMSYFFELAEAGRDRVLENGGTPVLLYMDFSGMKFFNTKYGFLEGDNLLRAFAEILAGTFGNEHSCRISADHFAVQTEKDGLDNKLLDLFAKSREMNEGKNLPVHIGVYIAESEPVHASVACDRAKMACGELSGRYETAVSYYDQNLSEEAAKRQYIIENIDRAIKEKWIQMYLQPIIRAVSEQVCDVEALARWIDPEKGFLSPADFIPALEDARLIYKLDLYMVDQILDSMKEERAAGFYAVPHSVNLSRSDFDACDIVEEIRKRVDEAGMDRALLNIEITESIIGSDLGFMKEQIERFRNLGFPVWMDDFGSGYSSLDVLQSIQFDLIKFDMGFMRKLDEGDGGKIILTELMKMAASLGVDTVCEGVETEEQVRFLREIGCSKLQGFYFSKPIPFGTLKVLRERSNLIQRENPQESRYYERIGRVNLFDLSFLANLDDSVTKNTFDTVPMGIMEVSAEGDKVKYVRSNQSFRDFMRRAFGFDLSDPEVEYTVPLEGSGSTFMKAIEQSRDNNNRIFVDEEIQDGAVVHSFVRILGKNPVNGKESVAIAVLFISESGKGETYADIAQALAADYYNIFAIDLDTNDYIEYSSQIGGEELSVVRHGEDFFASARREAMTRIYEEDREPFLALFTKENVLRDIEKKGVFTTTYRLIDTGSPVYVNMKITRMHGGNFLILGISIIDAHMKQQEEARKISALNQTITSLLDSIPGMAFTKDTETGIYLACNQAFAEYAHKETPDGVVGLTDAEIFDAETAAHFVEDDQAALRMDKPYIFFEDVPDAAGNQRQFWTTKLKYTDPSGRLCLQGFCQDVTGILRLQRENTRAKEDYRKASDTAMIFTHLAHGLARGYTDLYYVNMDNDEFIEFNTDNERGVLSEARRGSDFFEGCKRDARLFVHPEDQEAFVQAMNREFLSKALEGNEVFELVYRRIKDGRTFYVLMRVTRMEDDPRFIVLAVRDIDEVMQHRREEARIREERVIYARLHAITGNFIVIYVVDPETNHYREFSATSDYVKSFDTEKTGTDFFSAVRRDACVYNHPQDLSRFLAAFTKENILAEIERSGIFTWGYRIMMDGKPLHVQMKAALVEEKDGPRLIVGVNDIDQQVRQETEMKERLDQAQSRANIDALTGIKNKHAYLEMEALLDRQITDHQQTPFAIVILDVNNLKKINDSFGHQAGDRCIRDASKIICDIFKRSPVFRVGGDEFAVIAQGQDYEQIDERIEAMRRYNEEAARANGIGIACGMSRYENDKCVAAVFERADQRMYENKHLLKSDNDRN